MGDIRRIVEQARDGAASHEEFIDRCRAAGLGVERTADGQVKFTHPEHPWFEARADTLGREYTAASFAKAPGDQGIGSHDGADIDAHTGVVESVVDTPGVLADALPEWCDAADMVLVPMLPSSRDLEPTLRTIEVARKATDAPVRVVVNQYNPYGILDRQLAEYLESEGLRVIGKVPKAVALAQAAAQGCSVSELRNGRHALTAFERLADEIETINQEME